MVLCFGVECLYCLHLIYVFTQARFLDVIYSVCGQIRMIKRLINTVYHKKDHNKDMSIFTNLTEVQGMPGKRSFFFIEFVFIFTDHTSKGHKLGGNMLVITVLVLAVVKNFMY